MEQDKLNFRDAVTWFWRWFLNNKVVTILLISLLISLNLLVFSKITYILTPIKQFISIVGLPIIMAGVLFYLVNPLIDWMESKKIPRVAGIALIFIVITGLIVWGIVILIPIIREQTLSLVENMPTYWDKIIMTFDNLLRSDIFSRFETELTDFTQNIIKSVSKQSNEVMDSTVSGIGNVVGTITNIAIAIITMPILLFFLLKDGRNLPHYIMKMIPTNMRLYTYDLLKEINTKISQYIRGQLLVAFFVGLMFWIGFVIIGLEYAVLLAIMAGVLNLVPYLGSFLAMIPIVIVALVASPFMLVKIIILFSIEQLLEGRLIQPLILGSNLQVHPVTIIVVLLAAGKLFGVVGVIIGIPAYAVFKVIVQHVFVWYKTYSGLYASNYNPAPEPSAPIAKIKKKKNEKV